MIMESPVSSYESQRGMCMDTDQASYFGTDCLSRLPDRPQNPIPCDSVFNTDVDESLFSSGYEDSFDSCDVFGSYEYDSVVSGFRCEY